MKNELNKLLENRIYNQEECVSKIEQLADELVIEFAIWLTMFTQEFEDGDIRYWNIDKWELKTYEELLQIYKKQQE